MSQIEDVDHYCRQLARTSFFEDFEDDELRNLVEACRLKRLAPREALWAVGTTGDSAYILVDGRLERTRRVPPDDKRVDQVDETGAMVGLPYLVTSWEHESGMAALERTELLELKRPTFQKMFDDEDIAAYRLVDHLAEKLVQEMRDANERLQEVFGNPAETLRMLRRRVRST